MSASEVIKMIKDKGVKYVDLRFTDTKGKEQHVSVPARTMDEDAFEDGKMFDGSSIAGWKGINDSDMILMPDADSVFMDPFFSDPTAVLRCDVIEPSTMQGYERDPRTVAKRAEEYMRSTGIADTAYFGPEPEFFVFDDVRWSASINRAFYEIDADESSWNSDKMFDGGNPGHRPTVKGGYFPVPPVDSLQDLRSAMCLVLDEIGIETEVHHHEVATAGQCE
ncbi:MAG: glutamine synthetase beta-grasp domain-containing protein, partial [Gammaproteobacteria bacterium]|nr:glutamine synthetase beta-grasp domain-containing protein [Gammaproteobacteria bacterium]